MKTSLFLLAVFLSTAISGQIVNGNFQNGNIPSLSNWSASCGAQSASTSPTGGGNWCIQVSSGSTQGCNPGFVYQKLPGILSGQSFTLSGWALAQSSPSVGIFFAKLSNGNFVLESGITTTATTWTQLSFSSTFTLATGDTALVVLQTGTTGGPLQGYGLFDLIDLQAQITTGIHSATQNTAIGIFPNPFSGETIIKAASFLNDASLFIYNSLGECVKEIKGIDGNSIHLQRDNLVNGMYLIQLKQGGNTVAVNRLIVSD